MQLLQGHKIMTFKEYLKTEKGQRAAIDLYRKLRVKKGIDKKKHKLPQSPTSRHPNSSSMGTTGGLPADGPAQPSLS